jgi:hypothetical protein
VTWQDSLPSRAQRVTVFGETPSSLDTPERARNSGATVAGRAERLVLFTARRVLGGFGEN